MKTLNSQQLNEISGGYVWITTMGDIISLRLEEGSQFEIDGYTFTSDTSQMTQGGIYGGYQVVFSTNYFTTLVLTPVKE